MRQKSRGEATNAFLRKLTIGYVLVVLPAALIYLSLCWLTELKGRHLFDAFLPSALVFVILYLIYLFWPVLRRSDAKDPDETPPRHDDSRIKKHTRV